MFRKTLKNKDKKMVIFLLFLALFLIIGSIYLLRSKNFKINSVDNLAPEPRQKDSQSFGRKIDGVYVSKGEDNLYPVAVIIDNHPDARPAFGLSGANIVYEAEAEGGITRYLAIFANSLKIPKIGPIRSARPYFIDWAEEYNALFVHCGGSPEALAKIIKDQVYDLNEFYQGSYFWRSKDYLAPHNIFISKENIGSFLKNKGLERGSYQGWSFKDSASKEERGDLKEIRIDFSSPSFSAIWKYDIIHNRYIRHLGGRLHYDGSGALITAKNIIIQYLDSKIIDEKLRLHLKTSGSGKALLCQDGFCWEGDWREEAKRTRYYYDDGQEFKFNRGSIWIEIASKGVLINAK